MRRPTPNHRLNAYCTVIVRVSYGYGYTRGSGRVWVEIFGAGRVRIRVASSATGTGRVAEMVDLHTPSGALAVFRCHGEQLSGAEPPAVLQRADFLVRVRAVKSA